MLEALENLGGEMLSEKDPRGSKILQTFDNLLSQSNSRSGVYHQEVHQDEQVMAEMAAQATTEEQLQAMSVLEFRTSEQRDSNSISPRRPSRDSMFVKK